MSPYQMQLHSERQERLVRMGGLPIRYAPVTARIRFGDIPKAEPVPEPEPPQPEPSKLETWFRIMQELPPQTLKVGHIQRAVALHYSVRRTDLLSERRSADVVKPRMIAAYLAKRLTTKSYPEIGKRFGGRDHTTVRHAFIKISERIERDPALAEEVGALEERLRRLEIGGPCPTCGACS